MQEIQIADRTYISILNNGTKVLIKDTENLTFITLSKEAVHKLLVFLVGEKFLNIME